jgi:hypothetical protein
MYLRSLVTVLFCVAVLIPGAHGVWRLKLDLTGVGEMGELVYSATDMPIRTAALPTPKPKGKKGKPKQKAKPRPYIPPPPSAKPVPELPPPPPIYLSDQPANVPQLLLILPSIPPPPAPPSSGTTSNFLSRFWQRIVGKRAFKQSRKQLGKPGAQGLTDSRQSGASPSSCQRSHGRLFAVPKFQRQGMGERAVRPPVGILVVCSSRQPETHSLIRCVGRCDRF